MTEIHSRHKRAIFVESWQYVWRAHRVAALHHTCIDIDDPFVRQAPHRRADGDNLVVRQRSDPLSDPALPRQTLAHSVRSEGPHHRPRRIGTQGERQVIEKLVARH